MSCTPVPSLLPSTSKPSKELSHATPQGLVAYLSSSPAQPNSFPQRPLQSESITHCLPLPAVPGPHLHPSQQLPSFPNPTPKDSSCLQALRHRSNSCYSTVQPNTFVSVQGMGSSTGLLGAVLLGILLGALLASKPLEPLLKSEGNFLLTCRAPAAASNVQSHGNRGRRGIQRIVGRGPLLADCHEGKRQVANLAFH